LAEPLKNSYGPDVPRRIAQMIASVHPRFDAPGFVRHCLAGYEELALIARGWKIADAMHAYLPKRYPEAVEILVRSMGPRLESSAGNGMAPFLYMPHAFFVARYGLEHFEPSMRAQYEITKRFTAEFSIRPFLERHPQATLARLAEWTRDPDPHVRRLVSEGTRPRLPWASRLREFQRDPAPVLALLERLKDDPALYVRRSVANNLNDIGKDHPEVLFEVARRWKADADANRQWIVKHALRSAVKRGEAGALRALGFGASSAGLVAERSTFTPRRALLGGAVTIAFDVRNAGKRRGRAVVDLRIHFVKASGRSAPKVFKLKVVDLAPGEAVRLSKKVSLADLTTRRHHPGRHAVDALIDGKPVPIGSFVLAAR
jgi:3-methyladenine DNA glycosylase AlkC